jgi:hypothetical protein
VTEFSDRYSATGTPYPNPETMCQGRCEGMGCVPVLSNEMEEPWRTLWREAEERKPTDDGWHFVICPDCSGTRLKPGAPVPENFPPPLTIEQAE